ncbi:hypothetical protein PB2503_09129 [Parvularcula bermudensis HTCC2503]|uniref:Peptidase M28 domain-containing protein n=1 Tax=Parvularcula bermudensis (strain ATCC BAA-594 / HTCC2503 / KCTC 12087) TaxID=314260 RepID=E0TCU0_PARBH|nr:M28 family peptidase [Parvularcula bermudensis]ADM09879.1 hypothetical protein PB2503_09129 [Parvularcula bermudensis HTCC2503]
MFDRFGAIALLVVLSACVSDPSVSARSGDDASPVVLSDDDLSPSARRFKTDLTTLASDAYQGREAGTPGYDKAVDYVVAAYEKIGLVPAGDDGTYLQSVPLRRASLALGTAEFSVSGQRYQRFEDYAVVPSTYETTVDVSGDVVFMGYGLDAPVFDQTAYREIDVTGKIVAVLQGVPEGLPSEEAAHFSRLDVKVQAARAYGAAGLIVIRPIGAENNTGLDRRVRRPMEQVILPEDRRGDLPATAVLTRPGTTKLLKAAGITSAQLDAASAPLALNVSVRIVAETVHEDFASPNVVGMIEGSDPELKDEYVVLTAHLDHIGELRTIAGAVQDGINNGAMDNASGIATLLEEARKFSADKERPRRSILFLALTAEEKGLLGSEYFANAPTIPREAMVANVNLDMPILLHDFTDVIAFGAAHSSLKQVAEEAGASMSITLTPDPVPEMVLFVRSDHYNFVRIGVPSIFLFLGFENGGKESFEKFMAYHYHQPSDESDLPILYNVAARFAELNYRIAKQIANADEAPTWNEGDFFGDHFSGDE